MGDVQQKAAEIVAGLGGAQNIRTLEPCITRLRVEVNDADAVDEDALKRVGAFGVVTVGSTIQVVVGPEADEIAEATQLNH